MCTFCKRFLRFAFKFCALLFVCSSLEFLLMGLVIYRLFTDRIINCLFGILSNLKLLPQNTRVYHSLFKLLMRYVFIQLPLRLACCVVTRSRKRTESNERRTDKKTKKRIARRRHGNIIFAWDCSPTVELQLVVSLAHTRSAIGGMILTLVASSFPLRVWNSRWLMFWCLLTHARAVYLSFSLTYSLALARHVWQVAPPTVALNQGTGNSWRW